MGVNYDFCGYVTKNDLKCSDGRTIRKDAFAGDDGKRVPLVYQHQHFDPENVLGHMELENKEDGVYGYGYFNNTPKAQLTKEQVLHGDLTHMSIYANQLTQDHGNVLHGAIREVSLVLAGANPGALIDFPIIAHSGEEVEDEAIFWLPAVSLNLSVIFGIRPSRLLIELKAKKAPLKSSVPLLEPPFGAKAKIGISPEKSCPIKALVIFALSILIFEDVFTKNPCGTPFSREKQYASAKEAPLYF